MCVDEIARKGGKGGGGADTSYFVINMQVCGKNPPIGFLVRLWKSMVEWRVPVQP